MPSNVEVWYRDGDDLKVEVLCYDGSNLEAIKAFLRVTDLKYEDGDPCIDTIIGEVILEIDDFVVRYHAGAVEVLDLNDLCAVFTRNPLDTEEKELSELDDDLDDKADSSGGEKE